MRRYFPPSNLQNGKKEETIIINSSLQLNQQALLIPSITRPVLSHDDDGCNIVDLIFWSFYLFCVNESSRHNDPRANKNRIFGTTANMRFFH